MRARSPLPIRANRGRKCVSLDAAVCARIGAGGYCGPARGRAPATSGRFRRKWAPISPCPWTSVRFSAGVVRCRLSRPGGMPTPRGVSGRFGLRNRPEVASGVRESLGERGGTVAVDELDAKLHPKLLRYAILLFKDPGVSKNGAQLIYHRKMCPLCATMCSAVTRYGSLLEPRARQASYGRLLTSMSRTAIW